MTEAPQKRKTIAEIKRGRLDPAVGGTESPMKAATRRSSAKPYRVHAGAMVPERPIDEAVDAIVELIKLNHPNVFDNVLNLGPSDEQRETLERRTIVARLRIKGIRNGVYIAEALGVSQPTIYKDFKILDALFLGEAISDVRTEKGLDFLRIESAIQAIMPQVENGSLPYIREMVNLLGRKAKLLGLDAPVAVNLVDWRAEIAKRGVDAGSMYEQVVQVVAAQLAKPVQTMTQESNGEVNVDGEDEESEED